MAVHKHDERVLSIRNFAELLDFCAENGKDNTAFSYKITRKEKGEKSFFELRNDVFAISSALNCMGLTGERIAIIGENSIEWIESFLAICVSGNVAVPLDKELSADELEKLLKRSNCKAIFYSESYKKKIDILKDNLTQIGFISFSSLHELIESSKKLSDNVTISPLGENDTAVIVYTSGTTGDSKGVMLSQNNLLSNASAAFERLIDALQNCNKILLLLPMHHTFGLLTGIIVPLMKLGHAYICNSLRRVVNDMQAEKPDVLFVVPVIAETIYKKLIAEIEQQGKTKTFQKGIALNKAANRFGIDLSRKLFADIHEKFGGNMKAIICGGAPISTYYINGFQNIGIEFLNGYGITECSPIVSVNGFGKKHNKVGSVGAPLICNKVRISQPDADGIGNVEVLGDNVMLGYLDDEQATAETFNGEWFITGDCGKLDKHGYLYLTGRKKNLIILSNGKNVSPEEIEEKLLLNDMIEEIVVFDSNGKITAELYPNQELFNGDEKEIYAVIDEYNKTVPPYKNIEKIVIRQTEFEKTSTMKIKRKEKTI
ncbi:MAG: AMP-binding protein [Faecalibacterium sp.]|nr:AMP-binding protein [Ruminococcus sp.]MCM1392664.1 AMP-binding protein [Ruminococcus sp.]MCM1486315.1 AMP-binding protein [Faecalibacterium sp.]